MDISAVALTDLNQAQSALNGAASRVSIPASSEDAVDLSSRAVALLQAKNEFAVNIDLVKVADSTTRTAISLIG